MRKRSAEASRVSNETDISVKLNLDGGGRSEVATGIGFFDHMLQSLTRHAGIDLEIRVKGDLQVDSHHTMEDSGLVLGQALREALADRRGITRFGMVVMPMDEALVQVALDISGRPYLAYDVKCDTTDAGGVNIRLFREFMQALVNSAGLTLHITLLAGEEVHHIIEAVFKGVGRALAQAVALDPRVSGVLSTKGILD